MTYDFNARNVYRNRVMQAINDEISTSAAQVWRWMVAQDDYITQSFLNGREVMDVAYGVIERGDSVGAGKRESADSNDYDV